MEKNPLISVNLTPRTKQIESLIKSVDNGEKVKVISNSKSGKVHSKLKLIDLVVS